LLGEKENEFKQAQVASFFHIMESTKTILSLPRLWSTTFRPSISVQALKDTMNHFTQLNT